MGDLFPTGSNEVTGQVLSGVALFLLVLSLFDNDE